MTIYLIILLCMPPIPHSQQSEGDTSKSKFVIHSEILEEDRSCLVNLPDSYHKPGNEEKSYPIIILLDGKAYFNITAGAVQFMSSSSARNYYMPETIIVAIENVDRERDFTVTKIQTKLTNTMGGGRNFLAFIETELIPYIDKHYHTAPDRTLVGHSLGGLLALNSYMTSSSIFNAYLSIDPSIWWDENMIKDRVDAILSFSYNNKLYIATANQGVNNFDRNKKKHDALYALMTKESDKPRNIKITYFEEENHRSIPYIAIYKGLKYLNSTD